MSKKVNLGAFLTFSTRDREVSGRVTKIVKNSGYTDVYLDVDGMTYIFGTGGHLGDTWTTESGSEQWFLG